MKERILDFDDTDLALVGLTVLAVSALFVMTDPTTVLTASIAAIAGLAQGRRRNENGRE